MTFLKNLATIMLKFEDMGATTYLATRRGFFSVQITSANVTDVDWYPGAFLN